ncbi:hypothetical protein [Streptomyces sp. NPDC059092]|uniref:hypothetical protein n=1 Tax=Streptomyces sp. NPDC059092 TaxID=3346725 RepID=UPI0036B06C53
MTVHRGAILVRESTAVRLTRRLSGVHVVPAAYRYLREGLAELDDWTAAADAHEPRAMGERGDLRVST